MVESFWKQKKIEKCIVISPIDKMNPFYSDFVPKKNIYYELKSEIIQEILDEQKKNKGTKKMCVILDDCLSSKGTWAKDQTISELLFNGRHYGITTFLTMQFPLALKPELRCNFDYVLLMSNDNLSDQKRIFDHYCGIFPKFDLFRNTLSKLTENFRTMIIMNREGNKQIEEKIKHFKAIETKDFFVDCPEEENNIYNHNDTDIDTDSNSDIISNPKIDQLFKIDEFTKYKKDDFIDKKKLYNSLTQIIEMNQKIVSMNEKACEMLNKFI
jgi:hypothetical protein